MAAPDAGRRLDAVLSGWLDAPRTQVQQLVAAGAVLVDGNPVAKSHRLTAGEEVVVLPVPEPVDDTTVTAPLPIRYRDEHVAVVAKPAGLVVHAGAGTRGPTLVDALREMGVPLAPGADPTRPGIVHRLDRGTSGLLIVAQSPEAFAGLSAAFRAHDVDRVYWALVDGTPETPRATIDAPIARSTSHRTRFVIDPTGRPAVSHYDVETVFRRCAVVRVRLETGRTHQVRVHMKAVGHPVTGDRAYGASADLRHELGLTRPALHARHLGFTHPITGEHISLDEPLPGDLAAALARLEGR